MPAPAATFHPLKLPLGSRHPLPRPWPRPPAQRPGQSGAQHGAILPNPRRAATIPSRALNDYTYSTGDHPFLVPRTGHSYAHEPALCRVQGRRRAGNFVRLGFIYSASSFAIFFRPGRLCLSSTLASSPSPPPPRSLSFHPRYTKRALMRPETVIFLLIFSESMGEEEIDW